MALRTPFYAEGGPPPRAPSGGMRPVSPSGKNCWGKRHFGKGNPPFVPPPPSRAPPGGLRPQWLLQEKNFGRKNWGKIWGGETPSLSKPPRAPSGGLWPQWPLWVVFGRKIYWGGFLGERYPLPLPLRLPLAACGRSGSFKACHACRGMPWRGPEGATAAAGHQGVLESGEGGIPPPQKKPQIF